MHCGSPFIKERTCRRHATYTVTRGLRCLKVKGKLEIKNPPVKNALIMGSFTVFISFQYKYGLKLFLY